ncbi:MAG: outer membrane beta-barrel protein [Rhodomicrobium sp.]
MARSLIGVAALLAGALTAGSAVAQGLEVGTPAGPWNAAVVTPSPVGPAPIGFGIAPGATFIPSAFTEIGYDSNPNQTFTDQKGSAFIRSGAGFNASSVTSDTVANLTASGSVLDYFNDGVYDQLRFAGAVKGNVSYLVQPGVTVSSGAFINYDGQNVFKTQSAGADIELGYRDARIATVLSGRFLDVQYSDDSVPAAVISPLFLTSAFNYNRSDGTWTALLGPNWRAAPYVELGGGHIDYTDRPNPALLNRSADDFHAKTGVRLTISPEFAADLGWRYNERDTEDRRVPSYSSNFFDGSFTWRPSPFFFISGSIERVIGEPTTALAIMSDIRSYSLKATYLPVPGVTVSGAGGWQIVKEIGAGLQYHAPFAEGQIAWDYNNHTQFYTTVRYQDYDIDWQYQEFNEVRVIAGVRIVPDGQDLLTGESLDSLVTRLARYRSISNADLTLSGGYSWFGLPDMKFVTIVGGPLFDQAIGQENNGDGDLNGWRTDLRLANFAEAALPDGRLVSFGLSGFFANYQGTKNSRCNYTLTTDCAIVNIVDFNPFQENNTGPFGNLNVTSSRNVNYYGFAIDARLGSLAGSLKDGTAVEELSPFKVGLAMRRISETAKLMSVDPLVCEPVNYKEKLNTHYYGGYIGIEKKAFLGDGWTVGVDATAGLYYTDTEYQGRYNGYSAVIPVGYVREYGMVDSSLDRGSFIGTVRLDLSQQLGWGTFGIFGQGEYLSYVPGIAYNNNDQAGGAPWGIVGTQIGTRIKSDDAFNFTTGLNVSFKVN